MPPAPAAVYDPTDRPTGRPRRLGTPLVARGGRHATLHGRARDRAELQGAELRGAELQGTNLWGAQLQGAGLEGAQLQGADLRRTALWQARFEQDSDFSLAELRGTNVKPVTPFLGRHS